MVVNKNKIKSIVLFLCLWLCIGFPLGLWVLLAGPSKWLADYAHSKDMEMYTELLTDKILPVSLKA